MTFSCKDWKDFDYLTFDLSLDGGTLHIESRKGQGTTLRVTLPLRREP